MSIHLGVPRPGKDTTVVMKSVCKYLCRIYYALKKVFKYMIVVEKMKDATGDKDEIYAYSNMSGKSAQRNQ